MIEYWLKYKKDSSGNYQRETINWKVSKILPICL